MGLKKGEMGRVETDSDGKISAPDYLKAHSEAIKSENKVNGNIRTEVSEGVSSFKESSGATTMQTISSDNEFSITKENITVE